MRRRRWFAALVGVGLLGLTPVMAGAAPLTGADYGEPVAFYRFCAEAQVDTANIDRDAMDAADISVGGTIYEDLDDFVSSKSAVSVDDRTILTRTYVDFADDDRTVVEQLRCKLRTAESLDEGAWPEGAANNGGRFAVDPSYGFGSVADGVVESDLDAACSTVNQQTVDNVWQNLVTEGLDDDAVYKPTDSSLVVLPDEPVSSGPEWVGLGVYSPPVPLVEVSEGVVGVASRALFVPTTSTEGVPRFRGAAYCTFVGPDHLRAVMLGETELG